MQKMKRWFRKNWLAPLVCLIVLGGFATLYNNWLAFSALATLLLALAAFWTIWENRQTRREDREKERKARSAEELCQWAEEALRLYLLPYNYHKGEKTEGLSRLIVKNMLMVIASEIIGNEFIELTRKAEEALTKYALMYRDRHYHSEQIKPLTLKASEDEFEQAFYPLLAYLYVLRYWDYDYHRFLDDATENGVLKPKYQQLKDAQVCTSDKLKAYGDKLERDKQ